LEKHILKRKFFIINMFYFKNVFKKSNLNFQREKVNVSRKKVLPCLNF